MKKSNVQIIDNKIIFSNKAKSLGNNVLSNSNQEEYDTSQVRNCLISKSRYKCLYIIMSFFIAISVLSFAISMFTIIVLIAVRIVNIIIRYIVIGGLLSSIIFAIMYRYIVHYDFIFTVGEEKSVHKKVISRADTAKLSFLVENFVVKNKENKIIELSRGSEVLALSNEHLAISRQSKIYGRTLKVNGDVKGNIKVDTIKDIMAERKTNILVVLIAVMAAMSSAMKVITFFFSFLMMMAELYDAPAGTQLIYAPDAFFMGIVYFFISVFLIILSIIIRDKRKYVELKIYFLENYCITARVYNNNIYFARNFQDKFYEVKNKNNNTCLTASEFFPQDLSNAETKSIEDKYKDIFKQ